MTARLSTDFYRRNDVVQVSRDLLGKYLVTHFDGQLTSGRIVETEAYRGPDDKACHAWNNRLTPRTRVMYEQGGHAYVYLCYGIHHLFNVVTAGEGEAHAVLIRAIEPVENIPLMLERRGLSRLKPQLTAGPGALSKALGITTAYSGIPLWSTDSPIWIEDRGDRITEADIGVSARIGVESAGECALWPWRFFVGASPWVSGRGRERGREGERERS
jgi:DNA-3-methyladenine glycosylase